MGITHDGPEGDSENLVSYVLKRRRRRSAFRRHLGDLAARIPDPEKRQAALDLIEGARTKKPTQLALVDLDDPYRRRR